MTVRADETINGKTVAEWAALADSLDAQADDCDRRERESFERCDTDGFVSQWCHTLTGRELRAKARIARDHGFIEITALLTLDGDLAAFRTCEGQYGMSWIATDAGERALGRRFLNDSKARSFAKRCAANRAKGFTLGSIRVPGGAKVMGSGTGLSGLASCYVGTFPYRREIEAGQWEIVESEIRLYEEKD